MRPHPRVLVVDDEPQLLRVLRVTLEARGFDLRTAANAPEALDLIADWTPDLVITDLSMPEIDGLELTKRLRSRSRVPIVVLSVKGDESTTVAALDAGADDYVIKPFGMGELTARIRAALESLESPATTDEPAIVQGDFQIERNLRKVRVGKRQVHLTAKEFDLLVYLALHPGQVLTYDTVLGAVWAGEHSGQTEYLRVIAAQLRKKIEPDPAAPLYVHAVPWVGYRFEPGA